MAEQWSFESYIDGAWTTGAAPAGRFRGLQLVEALTIGGEAAGDEQFGDQLVLGAEMIIHRGQVDVGRGDDVAQRHVAKTALGVKPLRGGKDRGPGVVGGHGIAFMRRAQQLAIQTVV